jgi:hypothetical protein
MWSEMTHGVCQAGVYLGVTPNKLEVGEDTVADREKMLIFLETQLSGEIVVSGFDVDAHSQTERFLDIRLHTGVNRGKQFFVNDAAVSG